MKMKKLPHVINHIERPSDEEKRATYNISETKSEEFCVPIFYMSKDERILEGYISKDNELYKNYSDIEYVKDMFSYRNAYIKDNQVVFKVSIQDDHDHHKRSDLDFDLNCIGWQLVSKKYEEDDKKNRQKTYRIEFVGKSFTLPEDEWLIRHILSAYFNMF